MFKKLSAGLAACMLVALLTPSVYADSKVTMTVPRVADGAITIDGEMDDIYSECTTQDIAIQDFDNFTFNPESLYGKFWACYDSNYFYLYVDATEEFTIDYESTDVTNIVSHDALGMMLDFDYNRDTEYAYSYADNGDRVGYVNLSGDGYMATYHIYSQDLAADDTYSDLYDKIQFATVPSTDDNHILFEVALPIPADQDLTAGIKIGLGVLLNNAEFGGERVGQALWTPEGGEMWRWSDACGTVVLGELVGAVEEAPVEEAPAEEVVETPVEDAPVVEEVVEAPVEEAVAPATADLLFAPIAAVLLAAAGFVATKKNH